MKKTANIQQLRKRFGIKDHWGVSDAVVQQMAKCRFFDPKIPGQAASNHALRGAILPAKSFRESALRMARLAEEHPESISFIVLGQIIEYHLLADWLSGNQDASH
jgi:hypothetical protein